MQTGPPAAKGALGIREVMDHLRAAFFSTVKADGIRAEELTGQDGPQFHTIDLTPGVLFRDANVTVTVLEENELQNSANPSLLRHNTTLQPTRLDLGILKHGSRAAVQR